MLCEYVTYAIKDVSGENFIKMFETHRCDKVATREYEHLTQRSINAHGRRSYVCDAHYKSCVLDDFAGI